MLCLLGIGLLQNVAGRARIPEVAAEEEALGRVVVEYREIRRVRVSLRRPLAGPEMHRSRIRDHRQIDRRDRSAEADVRHVTRGTGRVPVGGYVLVEIHGLAEQLNQPLPGALKGWRLTRQDRRRQRAQLRERFLLDAVHFTKHPGQLRVYVRWEDAGRVRIVDRARGWGLFHWRRTLPGRRIHLWRRILPGRLIWFHCVYGLGQDQ